MPDLNETPENSKPEIEIGKPIISTPKTNSVSSIANSLANSMPEIQEHVINEKSVEEKPNFLEPKTPLRSSLDEKPSDFDPNIHATDKDGNPKFLKDGKTYAKKRGRKSGSTKSVVSTPEKPKVVNSQNMKARATGVTAAHTLMVTCVGIFGDEWRPVIDETSGIDEKRNLEEAFADYMEAKGLEDIPPNIALVLAVSFYVVPRLGKPKTKNRVGNWKTKTKQWFVGFSDKRKVKKKFKRREVERKDK